jgi:hypothetical protein
MGNINLPDAFYSKFPAQAAAAVRAGATEWYAPVCPFCGEGEDRFHMFAATKAGHGDRYWCRACLKSGFVDERRKFSEAEKAAWAAEQAEFRKREREAQRQRAAELTRAAYWQGYHDGMKAAGRQAWRERGLTDEAQDYFSLGLTSVNGNSALSIPFHNSEWAVETVQYRFLGMDGSGKYKFEKGYPAAPFYCEATPDDKPFLIVEGAIKAAVLWWSLCVVADHRYNVVAVPSKTPAAALLERLGEEVGGRRAYIILDPDATGAQRLRAGERFADARYVSLPDKVDDMILAGCPATEIERLYIRQATLGPL